MTRLLEVRHRNSPDRGSRVSITHNRIQSGGSLYGSFSAVSVIASCQPDLGFLRRRTPPPPRRAPARPVAKSVDGKLLPPVSSGEPGPYDLRVPGGAEDTSSGLLPIS